MLSLTTKESIILFDNIYYSQVDGVAMGSPLGPTLANVFLCHHERKWLEDCPERFRHVYWYVDDIFVLFKKPEQLFVNYMKRKHNNIIFTFEAEKNGKLRFLDVNIFREKGNFVTSVYRKDTFSGVYTNFISFIPLEYKFGLVYALLNRCFCLTSDLFKFHMEVETLKKLFLKNGYSKRFFDTCISKFLNKMFTIKPVSVTVPKKELYIILPFLSSFSSVTKKQLVKSFSQNLKICKLRVIFKTTNRLKNYFRFKDVVPEPLKSCQIYRSCKFAEAATLHTLGKHLGI